MAKKKKYNKIAVRGNVSHNPTRPGSSTIIITQTRRGSIDIGDYMAALKAAENVDFPNRAKLYDIFDEILTDGHLYAVIQKRKAAILNTPIEFKRDGKDDERINEQLRSPWFQNFISDLLDTVQYGTSTFQFRREGNWLNYDLIPRKHVCPVRRMILKQQTDILGESFDEYADLISIGDPRDLGLLAKAALYVIYKRNAMSDFAQFIELYGHPLKEGTYDAWDEEMRTKLADDLSNMGGSPVIIHPEGTKINIHDNNSKGQSGELYKGFLTYCNDELSKLELGNTLTTESGDHGTQALGTVHQAGEDKVTRIDKQLVLNVLNFELTDIFTNLGFDTSGGEFMFTVPQNKDLSARIQIDQQLKNMGLPIDDDYFYETYGIPKPENYEEIKKSRIPRLFPDPLKNNDLEGLPPDPDEPTYNSAQDIVEEKEKSIYKKFLNWTKGIFTRRPKRTTFRGKMNEFYRAAAVDAESSFNFDNTALTKALKRLYEKDFNPLFEIEENLFNAVWDAMNRAVDEGFNYPAPGDPDIDFVNELKQNNAVFAAFKTHRMQNEIAEQLLTADGTLKSFAQFKRDTADLVGDHIDTYLQTEYDTAVIRAHRAADWKQFRREADILPNLKWIPSTSINPGKDHKIFWNRIWSINDPFLDEHHPGDRWNCKCSLTATDEPVTDNSGLGSQPQDVSPGLGGNPAVTGQIFSEDHPYFTDTYKGADKAVKNLVKGLSGAV